MMEDDDDQSDHSSLVKGIPNWLLADIVSYVRKGSALLIPNNGKSINRQLTSQRDSTNMRVYSNWTAERHRIEGNKGSVKKAWVHSHAGINSDVDLALHSYPERKVVQHPKRPPPSSSRKPQLSSRRLISVSDPNSNTIEDSISQPPQSSVEGSTPAKADVTISQQRMLSFLVIATSLNCLQRRLSFYWSRVMKTVITLQSKFRLKLFGKRLMQIVKLLSCCLRFRLNTRIMKKRLAINRIRYFIVEYLQSRTQVIVRRYLAKVRVCQRTIRSFLAINRARIQLVLLFWDKCEKITRKRLASERLNANNTRVRRKGLHPRSSNDSSLDAQWANMECKVRKLMLRMQEAQVKSMVVEKSCRGENITMEEARSAIAVEYDRRPHIALLVRRICIESRKQHITFHIRIKRKLFSELLHRTHGFGSAASSSISDMEARKLLLGNGEQDEQDVIRIQLAGIARMDMKRRRPNFMPQGSNNLAPREQPAFRPMFNPLLKSEWLGKSWSLIVEEAILQDLLETSNLNI